MTFIKYLVIESRKNMAQTNIVLKVLFDDIDMKEPSKKDLLYYESKKYIEHLNNYFNQKFVTFGEKGGRKLPYKIIVNSITSVIPDGCEITINLLTNIQKRYSKTTQTLKNIEKKLNSSKITPSFTGDIIFDIMLIHISFN